MVKCVVSEGLGIRQASRVFKLSMNTILYWIKKFKKKLTENNKLKQNTKYKKLELDEMYSFVNNKKNKQWLWIAVDKNTGLVVNHKVGDRSEKTLKKILKEIPKEIPKEILDKCKFYTDSWKSYNILPKDKYIIGKKYTRKVERTFLTFRNNCARFIRRGIRYSKSMEMHLTVIDLLVYFYNEGLMSKYET